ncbi:hypothetical protein [Streptomyces sp. H27-C3]|uniref:hypothetical protein n=1 Tax=Streptomyces sp. H27-C3 TaxID=3046305 RepID=UPI0024BBBA4C|nr:hypothetical protein [Streptomyces sp. H27-C3]MDJ0460541.1 hypothetical protein [Streptomyces sp. H27-C3]
MAITLAGRPHAELARPTRRPHGGPSGAYMQFPPYGYVAYMQMSPPYGYGGDLLRHA